MNECMGHSADEYKLVTLTLSVTHFRSFCFDQFDKNTGFVESMNNFMSSDSKSSKDGPFVFVTPFCNNDGAANTGCAWSETKKC